MLIIDKYFRPSASMILMLEELCNSGTFHVTVDRSKCRIGLSKSDQVFHNRSKRHRNEQIALNHDTITGSWYVDGFSTVEEARAWCYMSDLVHDSSGLFADSNSIRIEVSQSKVMKCLLSN